jgi:hypothetical protein
MFGTGFIESRILDYFYTRKPQGFLLCSFLFQFQETLENCITAISAQDSVDTHHRCNLCTAKSLCVLRTQPACAAPQVGFCPSM